MTIGADRRSGRQVRLVTRSAAPISLWLKLSRTLLVSFEGWTALLSMSPRHMQMHYWCHLFLVSLNFVMICDFQLQLPYSTCTFTQAHSRRPLLIRNGVFQSIHDKNINGMLLPSVLFIACQDHLQCSPLEQPAASSFSYSKVSYTHRPRQGSWWVSHCLLYS